MDHRPVTQRLSFDEFVLDISRGQLLRDGAEVPLRPQSFEMLCYLVRHARRLISREELTATIWPNRHVTDASLTQCIVDIRAALDDGDHRLIRTAPRRGYRFDGRVSALADAPRSTAAGRRNWPVHLAVLAVGFALLAVLGMLGGGTDADRPDEGPIVAVLSFQNVGAHDLAPGLVSALRDQLSRQIARQSNLRVISEYSVEQLEQNASGVSDIRSRLGADFALSGRIVADSSNHRLLVRLSDRRRDEDIWSGSFSMAVDQQSLVQLRTQIADAVVGATGATKTNDATDGGPSVASNSEAWHHYTAGRFHQRAYENQLADDDAWALAWYRFAAAIGADPDWAPPWAGLARLNHFRIGADPGANRQLEVDQTLWLIDRALSLDPDHGPTYESLGYVRHSWFLDWDGAESAYEEAERLGDGPFWGRAILENQRGRFGEATALYRRAIELDPLNLTLKNHFARAHMCAGRYPEAVELLGELERLQPENMNTSARLALGWFYLGEDELAREWLAENAGAFAHPAYLGLHYALMGEVERAERALDEMVEEGYRAHHIVELAGLLGRDDWALDWLQDTADSNPIRLKFVTCSPQARRLANDRRVAALLDRNGLLIP